MKRVKFYTELCLQGAIFDRTTTRPVLRSYYYVDVILRYIALHVITSYCTPYAPCCTVLHRTAPCCIVLHSIAPSCVAVSCPQPAFAFADARVRRRRAYAVDYVKWQKSERQRSPRPPLYPRCIKLRARIRITSCVTSALRRYRTLRRSEELVCLCRLTSVSYSRCYIEVDSLRTHVSVCRFNIVTFNKWTLIMGTLLINENKSEKMLLIKLVKWPIHWQSVETRLLHFASLPLYLWNTWEKVTFTFSHSA